MFKWEFQIASNTGTRKTQQDRLEIFKREDSQVSLAVLADGVGGYGDGGKAAQLLIDTAKRHFYREKLDDPQAFFSGICRSCHHSLKIGHKQTGVESATTCVMLLLLEDEAHWAHIGDSRLYHFRDGALVFKTRDHSLSELEDFELQALGFDSESSINTSQVFMCLGGKNDIQPDFGVSAIDSNDSFLLCSDGVWGAMHPMEIAQILTYTNKKKNLAEEIAEQAVNKNGADSDNTSLIIAQWAQKSEPKFINRLFGSFKKSA